ncbi:hypothetical protein P9112_006629 [Eukaryota sp. TZLM1-RC]
MTHAKLPLTNVRSFELTHLEQSLFNLFLEVVHYFRIDTTVRVAGGWVRDKVLNRPTKFDIDITVSNMMGVDFANKINEFLSIRGEAAGKLAVIEQNPEKSKHLETARMKLMGSWIDFCNLRSETYTADSRIPTARLGTAEEDALRRDFTVNALLYNLHSNNVEDYTGRSFTDLANKLISTPLDPLTTLMDDPLRVMRAIRFSSRLGFSLDDSLYQACKNRNVHEALRSIVSRERIGTELQEMMESTNAFDSIKLIVELGLTDLVFCPPDDLQHSLCAELTSENAALRILKRCFLAIKLISVFKFEISAEFQRILLTSCVLFPLRKHEVLVKNRAVALPTWIGMNSLKWAKVVSQSITISCHTAEMFHNIESESPSRLELGQILRKSKELWTIGLILAAVDNCSSIDLSWNSELPTIVFEKIIPYQGFVQLIKSFGLIDIWKVKCAFSGAEIQKLLNLARGPKIGEAVEHCIRLQIQSPQLLKEELKNALLESWPNQSS